MKAMTQGEKRRRKAARAAETRAHGDCPISGVRLSAAQDARQRAAQGDTEAIRRTALKWCVVMGWPCDEQHIRKTRDQRIATLYGRLAILGRISEDAHDAIREYEALDVRYRREVLGTLRVVEDFPSAGAEPLQERIRALTDHWMDAQGVIDAWAAPVIEQFHRALEEGETPPAAVTDAQAKCVEAVGHALARHFGIRA